MNKVIKCNCLKCSRYFSGIYIKALWHNVTQSQYTKRYCNMVGTNISHTESFVLNIKLVKIMTLTPMCTNVNESVDDGMVCL